MENDRTRLVLTAPLSELQASRWGQVFTMEARRPNSPAVLFRFSLCKSPEVDGDGDITIDVHTHYKDMSIVRYAEFVLTFKNSDLGLVCDEVPDALFELT